MQSSSSTPHAKNHDWEEDLAQLLTELTTVQGELLAVLAAKREAVGRQDLESVDNLQPRARGLLDRLQQCHDQRARLLQKVAAQGAPATNLARLAQRASSGNRGNLEKQIRDSAARMRLLQQQSVANWVIAQRSLLHISQMLEIIATGGRLSPTYGQGESSRLGGSLVNQEA